MMNFDQARTNMVDCQIHPMGVSASNILAAYQSVPREAFLPEGKRDLSYIDEDILLADKRFLMDAATHARLVQALQLSENDAVLDLGDGTGYSASILSQLAGTVITLEEKEELLSQAERCWGEYGYSNIVGFSGPMRKGLEKHAPYNAILINGSAGFVPQAFLDQLADGGRLVVVLRPQEMLQGKAMLYVRAGNAFSERCLFDSSLPYLPGFEPKHDFQF